jgi:hypothetical protein
VDKKRLLVEYRCHAKGCLLLAVWSAPGGPYFSTPRISRFEEVARRLGRYTEGLADKGRLDELPWSVPLICLHTHMDVIGDAVRAEAASRRPGRPMRVVCWAMDE